MWKQIIETKYVECHRPGWKGVWDALVSAITGNKRLSVLKPVTFSAWVNSDSDIKFADVGVKVEK